MFNYFKKYSFILVVIATFILSASVCFAAILDSWQNEMAYKPKPVLFLHGFAGGNPSDWDRAKTDLNKYFSGYQSVGIYLETLNFQDPNGSVDTYDNGKVNPQGNSDGWADKLEDKVNELLASDKYGSYTNKINLVCHSMGGLAARWYLANHSGSFIDKLILIGVPNLGSPLAKVANAVAKVPKLGWLTFVPVLSTASSTQSSIDMILSFLKIDTAGEAADDLDATPTGSGFIGRLNTYQQPTDIDCFSIVGIRWGLPNWFLFKDWNGGDWIVSKDSQLGNGVISLKDSTPIAATHWVEPEIAAKDTDDKILKFLDSTKPVLKITSPSTSGTTEIYGSAVRVQGKVYNEYLPADTKLIIKVIEESSGKVVLNEERSGSVKPSDLWIPNDSGSTVGELDEIINLTGSGKYKIICQLKNPAGLTSEAKEFSVNMTIIEGTNIIVHCHNPEGVEINSITDVGNAAAIYDGNTFIGYGANSAGNHGQPISLPTGEHAIKVIFNGITMTQNITLFANQTQVLTFIFERINIPDFLTSSHNCSNEGDTTEVGYGLPTMGLSVSDLFLPSPFGYPYAYIIISGFPQGIVHFTIDFNFTISSNNFKIYAAMTALQNEGGVGFHEVGIIIPAVETPWGIKKSIMNFSINIPINNIFDKWFIQNIRNGSVSQEVDLCWNTGSICLIEPVLNGYVLKTFTAKSSSYSLEFPCGLTAIKTIPLSNYGSLNTEQNTFLDRENLKVSSVPYDLLETGV